MTARTSFSELRAREFARLDRSGQIYLDHTGSALYPASLVLRHARMLCDGVFGNPHSDNPTSSRATALLEGARAAVLRFFDADSAIYTVCFTANATAACRLVGESFPFEHGSRLVLTADNHNSVNGMRELARRRGVVADYLPLDDDLRLRPPASRLPQTDAPSILAFPAQSNFSGVQHPLELVALARQRGYSVLLDAAAYVPTHPLSLHAVAADFVAVSFYKMFGYPTGVGALIARRESLACLQRPWFAGGTVEFVTTASGLHQLRAGAAAFEDGTPDFLAIAAVPDGLAWLAAVGMQNIAAHVRALAQRLLDGMTALRHRAGAPMARLYGPPCMRERGGTIAFNLLAADGSTIDHEEVVQAAGAHGISVRGGCFCNPGAAETAFGFPADRARRCFEKLRDGFTTSRLSACMDGLTAGAVRASLGASSHRSDVDRLLVFLRGCAQRARPAPDHAMHLSIH